MDVSFDDLVQELSAPRCHRDRITPFYILPRMRGTEKMRGRIGSPKRDAGDSAGVLISPNQTCMGFSVDLVAVTEDGHFLASEHSPVVPLEIGVARNGENVLEKAARFDARRGSVARHRRIDHFNGDGSRNALRRQLSTGKTFARVEVGRGELLDILKRLRLSRGKFRRLRLQAKSAAKGQG